MTEIYIRSSVREKSPEQVAFWKLKQQALRETELPQSAVRVEVLKLINKAKIRLVKVPGFVESADSDFQGAFWRVDFLDDDQVIHQLSPAGVLVNTAVGALTAEYTGFRGVSHRIRERISIDSDWGNILLNSRALGDSYYVTFDNDSNLQNRPSIISAAYLYLEHLPKKTS